MGVRLTGISTPVGGVSWEYTKTEENSTPLLISPGQKIKVFISSICGVEKYDKVRAELKTAIERTHLADVYTFESKGASTLSAGNHYTLALEDSDICIFLIDNADGIKPGVQAEIDTVKKHNIKALYYFCDETQKEKTALEQSLMGAHFAKSKTVHSFCELSQDGAQALIEGLYKKKTESPYSVTIGNNLDQYGEMLASSLIVSMYNGSLTHLLLIYEKIRNFVFYLSCKYDDWNLRLNLYKLAIFAGKEKEIKGIQDSYPEVLNNLTADEAASIMDFCRNHPIKYKRLSSQLLAFGSVGYFLDDKCYDFYEKYIVGEIKSWLSSDTSVISIGQNIFKCLSGVAYRMSQDILSEICCQFIEKHYSCWYMDMFKFINNCIDLKKMSADSAKALVEHINYVLDSEKEREQIKYYPVFLCVLRKQNRALTEEMDKKIAEFLSSYYEGDYKLETTEDENQDMPVFVKEYIERIQKSNEKQGKDGVYFGYGTREIATVRSILLGKEIICDADTLDMLISVVADTLLISKEGIPTKLDAIALLICIALKYPEDYTRNQGVYEKLFEQQKVIEVTGNSIISSNIDSISLKIGLQLLYTAMGKDVYAEILELIPYIQGDIATIIAVTHLIIEYLENSDDIMLPSRVESIILQNVLQWLHSEYTDIRWNATRILLTMSRNPENCGIVNNQLVNLIDSNSVYIKNLIMRNLHKMNGITDGTKEYIISKCRHDANFVVRMVCDEVEKSVVEK